MANEINGINQYQSFTNSGGNPFSTTRSSNLASSTVNEQQILASLQQALSSQAGSQITSSSITELISNILQSYLSGQGATQPQLPPPSEPEISTGDLVKQFASKALIEVAKDYIPEGYSMVSGGSSEGSVLALPNSEVGAFTNFLNSAGGYLGGMAGSAVGQGVGSAIGANESQTAALSAAGSTFGGAAAGGAVAVMTGTSTAASVGAGAAAGAAAAWPVAAVIAAYAAYSNIKAAKKAAGGGPLTDQEIKTALDVFGLEQFHEKSTPKELKKIIPSEMEYVLYPHRLLGKALFGSSKHPDQVLRDRVRKHLEKIGIAEKQEGIFKVKLADGTYYDIGADAKNRLKNADGTERKCFETDPANPFRDQVVSWADGFVSVITGGSEKARTDFVGYLTNAALSNANSLEDARQNLLAIFSKAQIPPSQITEQLTKMHAEKKITDEQYRVFLNNFISLTNSANS